MNPDKEKVPFLLTVLCILTLAGNGLWVIFIILFVVSSGSVVTNLPFLGELFRVSGGEIQLSGSLKMTATLIFGLFFIFDAASSVGAILMLKLKKFGLYVYAAAQLLFLIFSFFFGSGWFVLNLVFSAGFVFLYALNWKSLR